jgi:hypothetical protein
LAYFDQLIVLFVANAALVAKAPARVAATLKQQRALVTYLAAKVEKLEAQQCLAMLKHYGVSTEQLSPQERLFDEADGPLSQSPKQGH